MDYVCNGLETMGCCAGSILDMYQATVNFLLGAYGSGYWVEDVDVHSYVEDACGADSFPSCDVDGATVTVYRTTWAVNCISSTYMTACSRDESCLGGLSRAFVADVEASTALSASEVFVSGWDEGVNGILINFYVVPTEGSTVDYEAEALADSGITFDSLSSAINDNRGFLPGCNVLSAVGTLTSPGFSYEHLANNLFPVFASQLDETVTGTYSNGTHSYDVSDDALIGQGDVITELTLSDDTTAGAIALSNLNISSIEMWFNGAEIVVTHEATINLADSSAVTSEEFTSSDLANVLDVVNSWNAPSSATAIMQNTFMIFAVILFVMATLF